MIALLLKLAVVLSSGAIFILAESVLNHMNKTTPLLLRVAYLMLAAGAIGQVIYLMCNLTPDWHDILVNSGVILLLLADRRKEKGVYHGNFAGLFQKK